MNRYNKNKPETIQAMFGSIAKSYDRTNAVLSFGLHKYWNAQLIKRAIIPTKPKIILDLCCGTGEIAFTFLKENRNAYQMYLLDFCSEMLECAKEKQKQLILHPQTQISYIQGDAQAIPKLPTQVDCVTIAYGIRNIQEPSRCFHEVLKVLKPGGTFGILELTQPTNFLLKWGHCLYLRTLLPILGRSLSANQEAYQYLCNSIQSFIQPQKIEQLLIQGGFKNTSRSPLLGGIATVIIAKKPI